MKTIFKVADNIRYISEIEEFKNKLPKGILSKKMTDVGGSYSILNSPESYILVAPTRDLVDNKMDSKDNLYPVFGVMGGTSNSDFRIYAKQNNILKFIVTYDSLPKLLKWLEVIDINPYNINICFDEFHLLLSELGYRQKAVTKLLKEAQKFDHYTFMSATPIEEDFFTEEFKALPYTELDWGKTQVIHPVRIKTFQPYKATIALIDTYLKRDLKIPTTLTGEIEEVKELFIFMNSVKSIAQVIKNTALTNSQVKVVCANNERNIKTLGNIEISKAVGDNKRINFFTSKGFQGIDLYSEAGLIVVVSDASKKHTLVDIQTTLYQISGRLRSKVENKFKNRLWHFYSTGYTSMTKEEYKIWKEEQVAFGHELIKDFNIYDEVKRKAYAQRFDLDGDFCYYDEESGLFEYSEMKEKFSDYNFRLTQHIYNSGIQVRDAYIQAKIDPSIQHYMEFDNKILESVVTVSFSSLLEQYIELRSTRMDTELIERLEKEYPIFKEAYEKLGVKKLNSLKYNEKDIQDSLYDKSDLVKDNLFKLFLEKVGENNFISKKDAKNLLIDLAKELNIKSSVKTTDLKGSKLFELIESTKREGKSKLDGYILKQLN